MECHADLGVVLLFSVLILGMPFGNSGNIIDGTIENQLCLGGRGHLQAIAHREAAHVAQCLDNTRTHGIHITRLFGHRLIVHGVGKRIQYTVGFTLILFGIVQLGYTHVQLGIHVLRHQRCRHDEGGSNGYKSGNHHTIFLLVYILVAKILKISRITNKNSEKIAFPRIFLFIGW